MALDRKRYDEAVRYFERALEEDGIQPEEERDYDLQGQCHREIGTAYIIQALEAQEAAGRGRSSLAEGIADTIAEAVSCWQRACAIFEAADSQAESDSTESGRAAVALAKIRYAKVFSEDSRAVRENGRAVLRWWPPEGTGPDGYSTPEERIFSRIEAIGRDRYTRYKDKKNERFGQRTILVSGEEKTVPARDVLAILRGWGSAVPLIADSASACRGGGYFLQWRSYGLVIDPGLDFLHNFRAHKFHMGEINAVVVSHNHTDHNADLRAIDDVFYEMHKRADRNDKGNWIYQLFCDEQTKRLEFLRDEKDEVTHRTLLSLEAERCKRRPNQEEAIDLRDAVPPFDLPFRIHYFRARHGKGLPAFGLRIECFREDGSSVQIGFTCDTEYFTHLHTNGHFDKCAILVAHISEPTAAELLTKEGHKVNHLGYRGVAQLIDGCKPPLTLLGEFWAGFADMRIDLTKALQRICGTRAILPTSVGLFVDLNTSEIECTSCRRWNNPADMGVTAAIKEFGPLNYLCPLCRI